MGKHFILGIDLWWRSSVIFLC